MNVNVLFVTHQKTFPATQGLLNRRQPLGAHRPRALLEASRQNLLEGLEVSPASLAAEASRPRLRRPAQGLEA